MTKPMKLNLRKDITIALAIKFTALALLWFFFVRHHEVVPNTEDTTHHFLSSPSPTPKA
ncbi:MAG TPA: hypothetical protein VFT64_09635 [Rickettsiales bacterium]|nr:hypothetical protein [Rickettsiales bacterium]